MGLRARFQTSVIYLTDLCSKRVGLEHLLQLQSLPLLLLWPLLLLLRPLLLLLLHVRHLEIGRQEGSLTHLHVRLLDPLHLHLKLLFVVLVFHLSELLSRAKLAAYQETIEED